jgi:type III pantothenate kinase
MGLTGSMGGWAKVWRMSTQRGEFGGEWATALDAHARRDGLDLGTVERVVLCSVVPVATNALLDYGRNWLRRPVLAVSSALNLGITLGMEQPEMVGVDRIANAVAAHQHVNGPVIVVDLGTATKVEAITANGVFRGGAIAPGVQVMTEALASRAARLFTVPLKLPERAIGRNTVEAMQSGIVLGHIKMIEGLVAEVAEELNAGGPEVLVTGGHAEVDGSPFRLIGRHDPMLTLNGIRRIGELNP